MKAELSLLDLDFVEVGTADFDTITHRAERLGLKGVAVEPIAYYLDRLPEVQGCRRVQSAVGREPGSVICHYLDPDLFRNYPGLPMWLSGCSCIGRDHPLWAVELPKLSITVGDAVIREEVPQITFGQLVEQVGISSIGCLKIDAEGMDLEIMESWLDAAEQSPGLLAPLVMAESNAFCRRSDVRYLAILRRMESEGYRAYYGHPENIIFRRHR